MSEMYLLISSKSEDNIKNNDNLFKERESQEVDVMALENVLLIDTFELIGEKPVDLF